MVDGYFFAWYPVRTYKFWSKRLIPSRLVWLEYVSYTDTVFNGRIYHYMTKKDVFNMHKMKGKK